MEERTDQRDPFQEQVAALRRSQILDAATSVFAQRGFHRTTIREIAKAAGVADGTIYNYFANKTALLMALLDRLNESERREEHLAGLGGGDIRGFFAAYTRQRMEALSAGQGLQLLQLLLSEVLIDADLRKQYMEQIIEPTFATGTPQFDRLAATGVLRPVDVPLAMRVIAASVLGITLLRILGDKELEQQWDAVPGVLSTILFDGLLADDA